VNSHTLLISLWPSFNLTFKVCTGGGIA
jgi:hypothetical protein